MISGQASRYTITGTNTATVLSSRPPVQHADRRPPARRTPAKFNGVVIAEWTNVTNQWDQEVDWFQTHEHLLQQGYAWVGVDAQRVGLHSATGLRLWSPTRYGALDLTVGNTINDDSLSYDVFSQAVKAIRSPAGPRSARLAAGARVRRRHRPLAVGDAPAHLLQLDPAAVEHPRRGRAARRRRRDAHRHPAARVPHQLRGRHRRRHRQRRPPGGLADVPPVGGLRRLARRLEADHRLRPAAQARHRHLPRRLSRASRRPCTLPSLARIPQHMVQGTLYDHTVELGRLRHRAAVRAVDHHDDAHGQHRRA